MNIEEPRIIDTRDALYRASMLCEVRFVDDRGENGLIAYTLICTASTRKFNQARRHDLSAGVARKIWRGQESTSGHIGLTELKNNQYILLRIGSQDKKVDGSWVNMW